MYLLVQCLLSGATRLRSVLASLVSKSSGASLDASDGYGCEQGMMRKAVFDAGMISDVNSCKLVLCLEPEAACMACEDQRSSESDAQPAGGSQQILKNGQTFMVLDCGGGTVDITMHRVEATDPLRLSEVRKPTGS